MSETGNLAHHDHPAGVMAGRAAEGRPPRCDVAVRRRQRGSRQPRAGGEGQGERQGDGVAEVNRGALWQSAQAVGGVRGRWERRLWTPPVMGLQRDERAEAEESRRESTKLPLAVRSQRKRNAAWLHAQVDPAKEPH